MPIVVSRATGEIISKPELTQADRDRAWEAVVRAFAKRHPELLLQDLTAPVAGQHKENAIAQKREAAYDLP